MNCENFIQKIWSKRIQEMLEEGCKKFVIEHPEEEERCVETSKASGTMLNGVPIGKCSKLI